MIKEWTKYKGWVVLEYFLLNPNTKIHINELARELKIATHTAQRFCSSYYNDGLLDRKKIGNIHQFYLKEDDARAKALKKFMGAYIVSDEIYLRPFLEKNKTVLSVSLYGSFASGEYGDRSDLDILVITIDEKEIKSEDLARIELKLGREVNVTTINLAKWRAMERKKDKFFETIKKNIQILWGNRI
ncbi:nucleotidyltransferase domain-containing protein [Candidatus Micrarchaeota archaeon]|nr:nucleotidyltransferase domain-containing protein [Candidatus Micrarchaeota archaeon]